jgi:hypothetical protein
MLTSHCRNRFLQAGSWPETQLNTKHNDVTDDQSSTFTASQGHNRVAASTVHRKNYAVAAAATALQCGASWHRRDASSLYIQCLTGRGCSTDLYPDITLYNCSPAADRHGGRSLLLHTTKPSKAQCHFRTWKFCNAPIVPACMRHLHMCSTSRDSHQSWQAIMQRCNISKCFTMTS